MPRLANLLRRPEVASVERVPGGDALVVRVEGLACSSLCVRRTAKALGSLPGVAAVRFEERPDRFLVEAPGGVPDRGAVERAVAAVVVAPWARRVIAALAERIGIGGGRSGR